MPFDPLNPGQTGKIPERPVRPSMPQEKTARSRRRPEQHPKPAAGSRQVPPSRQSVRQPRPNGARPGAERKTGAAGPRASRPYESPTQKPIRRKPAESAEAEKKAKIRPIQGYQPKFAAKNRKKTPALFSNPKLLALILLLVLGTAAMIALCIQMAGSSESELEGETFPTSPQLETEGPQLPCLVSEATISVTGDLLPHKTIYSKGSVIYKDEQEYDFSPVFQYLHGYTDTADYAVANLETSLFGPGKPYSGNPKFNTPDQIVDGAKNAGFDMLLTANNHCNDTGLDGILRTVQVIRDRGLKALGTNLDASEQKYHIQELNGIRIGMLCYTYEDSQNPDQVTFNYNALPRDKSDLVCSFPKFTNAKSREPFYEGLSAQMAQMREQGAEAIVLFLHWGEEYHLEASADQREMAQRLCDLGVDVIVGGHPHVVEPIELLTSSRDPEHKTVCLYSLGNAFSNQRREEMTTQKSGHTEDGMLFHMTFQKYSDNSVYLSQVEVIPTWVNKHADPDGNREYNILPLKQEESDRWQTIFSLDEGSYLQAADSYSRTMNIVGPGLEASNSWLASRIPHEEPEITVSQLEAAS